MPALVLVAAPAGSHPRLRAETLARLEKSGYSLERRLETAQWADLFEDALTPGLFSSRQIYEVDDGLSLGPLPAAYAKNVEPDGAETVFLIFSEKTLQKNLGAAYRLAEVVPYEPAPYWPRQRALWLRKTARSKGWSLDADAASLLSEWIEDEEELRAELDKLGAASGGRVTARIVEELSIDEGGKGMLNLLDAVAKADVPAALSSFTALREEGEIIPVLAALHKRVRGACMVASLGNEAAEALRLTSFQSKTAAAMARLYGPELLALVLGELIRLSWSERTGDGEGWEGLEKLLLAAMSRAR